MAFQPGQSGNPGGRPKQDNEVKRLAKEQGPKAIEKLAALLDSADERTVIAAAVALLDRGYGKPAQVIGGDDELPPIQVKGILTFVKPE